MFVMFVIIFSFMTMTESFLLDTNSSLTALTSKEFDQLLDMIMKEEKARHQLEHYVAILEDKYKEQDANIHNLTSENTQLKSKNKALEASVTSLTSSRKEMNREIQNLTTTIHTLQNDFKTYQNNVGANMSSIALAKKGRLKLFKRIFRKRDNAFLG